MSRTIVITGASDGIGAAAARKLHQDGHRVVIVGRSPQKTRAIAAEIGADHYLADFARLDDVRELAAELKLAYPRIDVLANNAGGLFGGPVKTVDGFETNFQVNHLAPFLLTKLLMDRLIDSRATVIQTSSSAARLTSRLDPGDLEHEKDFTPMLAYGTTKLENILFTRELHRRYHSLGISAAAFHPGLVATSFGSGSTKLLAVIFRLGRWFMISPENGAEQLVWLATTTPDIDWMSGAYYEKQKSARTSQQALDDNLARQLWERSEKLLGV